MGVSKRFQFTVLSISNAGKTQGTNRQRTQFGALLIYLLTAKIYGCGVSSSALNIISSYLKHRTQQTQINYCFSASLNIEYGVPQGWILGPILFNINMIEMFYECDEIWKLC